MAKGRKPKKIPKQDAYVNTLTGLGDWTQDKIFGGLSGPMTFNVNRVTNREAEDRWRGSDLGARIVEAIPNEMLREWFELTIQPETEENDESDAENPDAEVKADFAGAGQPPQKQPPIQFPESPRAPQVSPGLESSQKSAEANDLVEDVHAHLEKIEARQSLHTALCYRRAYGGAAIYLGVDDGQDPVKPLNEDNIDEVAFLNVFSGGREGECIARGFYTDMKSPKYGRPEYYEIRRIGIMGRGMVPGVVQSGPEKNPETSFLVHESRVLVFDGLPVSRRVGYENWGWGDSIFTRVDEVLSYYNQTWNGIANLMADFAQAYLKVPGLAAALSMKNKASDGNPITKRAQLIQQTRSVARMMFIDEKEEFNRLVASLTGVDTVLQQFALRLAAAADMPVTLLMGQSPAGLNATGESDIRFFYDRIAAEQERTLAPQLKRLLKLIFLSKQGPTEGKEPEKWTASFCPLYQMSDTEKATLRYTMAQADGIYIDKGVLSAEEVASSAFGGTEYSMERTVDMDARQKATEKAREQDQQKQALMKQQMGQPAASSPAPSSLPPKKPPVP